jgi:DNA-binding NarL/FixJ family response regulator
MTDPAPPASAPVLIVDDHELVATSLVLGLGAEGIAARHRAPRAGGYDAVLDDAAAGAPGLVLLDLDLGRDAQRRPLDGVRLVEPLRAAGWRVLVLSGSTDRHRIGAALAAGAIGAVPKAAPFPRLLGAVRAALAGLPVMPEEQRRELVEAHERQAAEGADLAARFERLTPREREVLAHLAAGRRAQAVADAFVVSLATVRTQIRSIFGKLEVTSQIEAVALYRKVRRG